MVNNVDIDVNNNESNFNMGQGMPMGDMSRPLVEPMQERCVHRTIMHEVPHGCFKSDNNSYF